MKKAVRNMLSLVLTAALVFAMVGCSSGNKEGGTVNMELQIPWEV